MAGLLCGAYSSICIATELWYIMRLHLGNKINSKGLQYIDQRCICSPFYFPAGKRKITGSRHEETYDSVYNGMAQRLTLPYLPSGSTVKREEWMELRER